MSKTTTALVGAILAAAGFALGEWGASRSPARAADAAAPMGAEAARRAIAEQIRMPASIDNAERLAHLLAQLGPEAVPAIAPTLSDPSETLDTPRALLLIQFWIDRDPKGATQWAAREAPLAYQVLALQAAVERLAETDPQLAVRFVGPNGMGGGPMKPLIRGWVRSGKPGVEEWIRNLGYGFPRQKALGAFARAKIEHDGAAAAIAWLEALPESDDGFKREAFQRITRELTYSDPAAGVAWYEENRAGPYGDGMLNAVLDAWVAVDGPAAMRWLSQQPAGKPRDDAVLDGLRWWGMADVRGLRRWGRAEGLDRVEGWFQPGLPIFAKLLAGEDPLEGIRWAERIIDEPVRRLTLVQIARDWHTYDAAAAEAWLTQSPLSEPERARARYPRSV